MRKLSLADVATYSKGVVDSSFAQLHVHSISTDSRNIKEGDLFIALKGDSFDGHDVELASKHQLNEAKAVIDKLKDSSLILLDDKGAKTLYSKDYFVKGGFKILTETENQLLLSKIL